MNGLLLCALLLPLAAAYSTGLQIYTCNVDGPLGCPRKGPKGEDGYNKKLLANGWEWVPNRLSCNTTGRQMGWALAAARSDDFRVWVGSSMSAPATQYTPGRLLNVMITTMVHEKRFLGLMLYAVDNSGKKVGAWEFANEQPAVFRHPDVCDEQTLFHASAAFKNYELAVPFRAPAAGTGTITFKALVKIGPANTGELLYPNAAGDFKLDEGAPPASSAMRWLRAKSVGQSCDDVCAASKLVCDGAKLGELSSPAALAAQITSDYSCRLPLVRHCGAVGATSSLDNQCFFHDASCVGGAAVTCAASSSDERDGLRFCACREPTAGESIPPTTTRSPTTGDAVTPTSASASSGSSSASSSSSSSGPRSLYSNTRLYELPANCRAGTAGCKCDGDNRCEAGAICFNGLACVKEQCIGELDCQCSRTGQCLKSSLVCTTFGEPPLDDKGQPDFSTIGTCQLKPTVSSAGRLSPPTTTTTTTAAVALLAGSLLGGDGARWSLAVPTLLLLAFVDRAHAHNWINTFARSKQASTVFPCLERSSPQPHAQVGPGGEFQIEWMPGHIEDFASYFAILSESNSDKMHQHTMKLFDDYILNAPNGAGSMQIENRYRKFHRKLDNSTLINKGSDKQKYVIPAFTRFLSKSDPEFIDRPSHMSGLVHGIENAGFAEYPSEAHKNDRRVAYKSAKYPWILALHKYEHVSGTPDEPDVARFTIPTDAPPGNYVVHYCWAGYCDCIDISLVANSVMPQETYGIPNDGETWLRIDHCYFPEHRNFSGNTNNHWASQGNCRKLDHAHPYPFGCIAECERLSARECDAVVVAPMPNRYPPSVAERFRSVSFFGVHEARAQNGIDNALPARCPQSLMNAAQVGEYYCQAQMMRELKDTQPTWMVTEDPSDPAFYSTCYVRVFPNVRFPQTPALPKAVPSPQWRFGNRCATCDSVTHASYPYVTPRWEIASSDKCIDCDMEPVKIATPVDPWNDRVYVPTGNGTVCDGFGGNDNGKNPLELLEYKVTWAYPSKRHSCPGNSSAAVCVEFLQRPRPHDDGPVARRECLNWARNNPLCGKHVMHSQGWPYLCACYRKDECCKTCSGVSYSNSIVYEINPTEPADPTCANGFKSADGKACCSGTCSKCRATQEWDQDDLGFCNVASIAKTRRCAQYAAPCIIAD